MFFKDLKAFQGIVTDYLLDPLEFIFTVQIVEDLFQFLLTVLIDEESQRLYGVAIPG